MADLEGLHEDSASAREQMREQPQREDRRPTLKQDMTSRRTGSARERNWARARCSNVG
ncbi:hypothetical protein N9L68_03220 [bacterium]|nr:hypothetical protein [bacterium]